MSDRLVRQGERLPTLTFDAVWSHPPPTTGHDSSWRTTTLTFYTRLDIVHAVRHAPIVVMAAQTPRPSDTGLSSGRACGRGGRPDAFHPRAPGKSRPAGRWTRRPAPSIFVSVLGRGSDWRARDNRLIHQWARAMLASWARRSLHHARTACAMFRARGWNWHWAVHI